jgi:hypothetical protein
MKRMATLLATMAALSAVVPATAVADTSKSSSCGTSLLLLLRFC